MKILATHKGILPGVDPGFQDRGGGGGGALKKNALSRGRRDNFWGISCEKSRFYAKKIIFSPLDLPLPSIKETLLLDFLIYNNISVDS